MRRFCSVLLTVTLFGLSACAPIETHDSKSAAKTIKAELVLSSGIDQTAIDNTVRPQDDFHAYANGVWLKETKMPAEYGRYGTFTVLNERAERNLKEIVEQLQGSDGSGNSGSQIADLYASYMNAEAIEAAGLAGVSMELRVVDDIKTTEDLYIAFATLGRGGIETPLAAGVMPDFKNSEKYAFYIFQNGLGLPDRDYFLDKNNERFKTAVQDYSAYASDMLALAGADRSATRAKHIVELEEQLAEGHWTRTESRVPEKLYNPKSLSELKALANMPWERMLSVLGAANLNYIVVAQPSHFESLASLVTEDSLEVWKDYLRLRVLTDAAPYLSETFANRRFDFYGKKLSGLEKQKERWRRGVSTVSSVLGEPLGKQYVERHFPPEAKQKMLEMVRNLLQEFRLGIDDLPWMSEATKIEAKEKLKKIRVKIGYPDRWRDYSSLNIVADDLIGNMRRASAYEYNYELAKLGKPIDREEWGMNPHTVNAYYNPTMNEIVFPAGILQAPMFDLAADDAANYGAAGLVIGHEISHAFDDQGSTFDGDGNLRNWWTDEDRAQFKLATDKLVAQYSEFEPLEGMNINGELTLGENIGDLSGATVAVNAYLRSLAGKPAPVIDGLTGLQRFYLGYARTWRTKYRDEVLARMLVSDPHSPHRERVNGVVRNMPEFYEAFDVNEGDGHFLSEQDRVKVW
ncbi:MAG: M13 family metallopeptidase [Pseudomonadales bacterium]